MVTTRRQIVTGSARRTGPGTNGRRYITVHQTGNTGRGADAAAHANLQSRGGVRIASWHYQVDDHEAVQSYEHTDRCWHAGDGTGSGNYASIGVEHCVNADGDYLQTLRNGAELVARIADAEGIPTSRIVQHNRWSGKNCPTQIRAGQGGVSWADYLAMVQAARADLAGGGMSKPSKPAPSKPSRPSVSGKSRTKALQRAVHVSADGAWGPKTDEALHAVRMASRLKGTHFPNGVRDAQRAVGTKADGVWGRASRAAHDRTVAAIQRALGVTADGIWGPKTDAAFVAAWRADRIK